MKTLSFILTTGLTSISCFPDNVVSQKKPLVVFEYMRVNSYNDDIYMQIENLWGRTHLSQQKRRPIIAWNEWQVLSSNAAPKMIGSDICSVGDHRQELLCKLISSKSQTK